MPLFFFVHRMAPKLQPKEPNAKQTVKPKLKCAWSHCPPCTCKACTQTSHDVDRDSPSGAPKYVLWTKTKQEKPLHLKIDVAFVDRPALAGQRVLPFNISKQLSASVPCSRKVGAGSFEV